MDKACAGCVGGPKGLRLTSACRMPHAVATARARAAAEPTDTVDQLTTRTPRTARDSCQPPLPARHLDRTLASAACHITLILDPHTHSPPPAAAPTPSTAARRPFPRPSAPPPVLWLHFFFLFFFFLPAVDDEPVQCMARQAACSEQQDRALSLPVRAPSPPRPASHPSLTSPVPLTRAKPGGGSPGRRRSYASRGGKEEREKREKEMRERERERETRLEPALAAVSSVSFSAASPAPSPCSRRHRSTAAPQHQHRRDRGERVAGAAALRARAHTCRMHICDASKAL